MGLFSRFRSDDEPGAVSQPEGDGPVTLDDRVEPGGQGSPDTNQPTTEPLSPTPDDPEPLGAPDLSSMNVGAGDPQAPRHDALADATPVPGPGAWSGDDEPVGPESGSAGGAAHRAPGLQGRVPQGESVDTDVDAGAARMATPPVSGEQTEGQGDAEPAPVSGDGAAPGTSEQQPPVLGSRIPPA